MKRNYWKEISLILIGMFTMLIWNLHQPIEFKHSNDVVRDTIVIRDTVLISKTVVPPLNEENLRKELIKQNVPYHKIVLAQAKLETGNFKSKLCKTHNNIFGMRKGNKYRKYKNYTECVADYKRRISSKYTGGDYYDFINRLGYAEDKEYINKLKSII